jgi:hypothetical protein
MSDRDTFTNVGHRWYASLTIARRNGDAEEMYFCADSEHSGLWVGSADDHEDH